MYPSMVALLRQKIPPNLFKDGEKLIGQPKLDGIYFRLNVATLIGNTKDDFIYDMSRSVIFSDYTHRYAFLSLNITHFIGELVYVDPITKNITRDRSKVMDVLLKHKNYEEYEPNIKFIIFDVEFKKGEESHKTYLEAMAFLEVMVKLPTIPSVMFTYNKDAINNVYEAFNKKLELTNDLPLEGIVVRRVNSEHFQARSKPTITHFDWFKVKNVYTASLRVIAIKSHSKDPNLIGSFIVTDRDNILRASIGSGLTKELRHMRKEDVMDKIVEIEYEAIIEKTKALVHPRFKTFREDDKVDSYSKLINKGE